MINKVILIGNMGRDPEIKRFDNGSAVAKFSVATNESYKDKAGEWQTVTEWHNIVTWGAAAERTERDFKKGNLVYIEGKLTTRKWQDQEGKDNYTTEVRAIVLKKLERRESAGGYSGVGMPDEKDEFPAVTPPKVATPAAPAAPTQESAEDDLPF